MIYLYGASGHAKVIIEIFELRKQVVLGLIDINPEIKNLLGYPVFSSDGDLRQDGAEMIITIGDNTIRKKIAQGLTVSFATAIHPTANISQRTQIGVGTAIMAGVTINSSVNIGKHVIVNTNACIDHDCFIDNYAHISPNAALAGNVTVAEGAHIGIGACIIQKIKIGKWSTIGAGAVITKDVPDYAVVVGNPGKIIKYKKIDEQ